MNILIIGGGELGSMIAEQLIAEGHNITLIEKSAKNAKKLNDELDCYVLAGSGTDVTVLSKTGLDKIELFLALTNDDNVNIISCDLVKRLSHYKAYTIAKVENSSRYFSNPLISHQDFGIDNLIATKQLSINKILDFIAEPETVENINFHDNDIKIVGLQITEDFQGTNKSLSQIGAMSKLWKKVRVVAVSKNNNTIIPTGVDIISPGDKIFVIGNSESLKDLITQFFPIKTKVKKVIIFGGNRIGKNVAIHEAAIGKKVTIVEEDQALCSELSEDLGNSVLVINGSGSNQNVLNELDLKDSFVVCVTERDELNIITAVLAKRFGAAKAICNITNIAVSSIINELQDIDSAFSTESLALSEILTYCRKGEIISIYPIPNIKAEAMKVKITDKLEILDKPLKDIKFPKDMMIGVIIRDKKMIVPHGNDDIRENDFVISFILPAAKQQVKKIFSSQSK
jgi:trk system potassium uptake protein